MWKGAVNSRGWREETKEHTTWGKTLHINSALLQTRTWQGEERNCVDLHYVCLEKENLKSDGAPLLIGFNNSQLKTLKAVINHNINLDQKMKEKSLPWKKSIARFELYYIWHMKRYDVLTPYHWLPTGASKKMMFPASHCAALHLSSAPVCFCLHSLRLNLG